MRPLAILFLGIVAARCGDTAVSEVAVAPSGVRCQTSLATPPSAFPAGGGTVKVVVSAARECSWTLSSEAAWIQVSPASGQGESEATVRAAANEQARPRSGAVVVNDQRVTLTQEAAPCRFTLDRSETRIAANGGRFTVSVSTQSDCSWTASSNDAWMRVLNASRTGAASVEIEVQDHRGDQRTGRLTIAGQPFTVLQERYAPTAPAPAPPSPPRPSPGPAPQPPTPVPPAPTPAPDPKGPTTPPRPPGDRDNDDDDDDDDDKDDKKKDGKGRRGEVA